MGKYSFKRSFRLPVLAGLVACAGCTSMTPAEESIAASWAFGIFANKAYNEGDVHAGNNLAVTADTLRLDTQIKGQREAAEAGRVNVNVYNNGTTEYDGSNGVFISKEQAERNRRLGLTVPISPPSGKWLTEEEMERNRRLGLTVPISP